MRFLCRNGEWVLRRTRTIGAHVLIYTLILSLPAHHSLAQTPRDIDEIFDLFDQNGDGVIDRAEFDVNKIYVISAFDANGNDEIDREESNISDENFRLADKDGNGSISGFEFLEAPFGKFEALDQDGDQLVTREEFRQFVEGLRR